MDGSSNSLNIYVNLQIYQKEFKNNSLLKEFKSRLKSICSRNSTTQKALSSKSKYIGTPRDASNARKSSIQQNVSFRCHKTYWRFFYFFFNWICQFVTWVSLKLPHKSNSTILVISNMYLILTVQIKMCQLKYRILRPSKTQGQKG